MDVGRAPADWDLALLPVLGLDPLLAMAGGAVVVPEGDLAVDFRTRVDLFDENNRAMGEMDLSGQVGKTLDGIGTVARFHRCDTRFEMGERMTCFRGPSQTVLLGGGSNRILMARATDFSTGRGNGYRATGTAWWHGADPVRGGEDQLLEVQSLDFGHVSESRMTMRARLGMKRM